MSLAPGTQLGPYEITAALGAGGMGEVYRARDKRLDRTVAIKILPPQLSKDPVRKQRFEREAKTISSLNHPHICVLHDVGSQDGLEYLVMECIEGESLAKRLERGPLPVEQVLKYGGQMADALDKAHRSGVVHRDLKPGNVMLTASGAKLLDFGLAKPAVPQTSGLTLTATSIPTTPVTQEHTMVGTFQYMSPEQVEGKEVDGRSDIFSLGAVLYEMVTGTRAFEGKSQLSVASAILEKEPAPIMSARPMTPPALDHVIRKCLAKAVDDRWQSAADIKHELDWISHSSAEGLAAFVAQSKKAIRAPKWALAVGILVLVAAGALASRSFNSRDASLPVVHAILPPTPGITMLTLGDGTGAPAISRDGTNLVFAGLTEGRQMLFLRSLDGASVRPLPGTEGGKFPFWSPDGKSIGFFADQQLKRLDISGGPPINLAQASDGRGGSWAGDTILFAPYFYETIHRVSAAGGKEVSVTTMDRNLHTTHRWPHFLPDGKHFVFLATNHLKSNDPDSGIFVGSIDGGASKFVTHAEGSAFYASGELLFYRDGSLMAQEFDADRLELRGEAKPIGRVLWENGNWGVIATASENGVLLFQSAGEATFPVSWFDRSGRVLGPAPISGETSGFRISPDGTRIASVASDGPLRDIYISDVRTGTRTRLTFGESATAVAWSPDTKEVAYSVRDIAGGGNTEIYKKRTDGAQNRELLLASGNIDNPTDWTRDGRYIVFDRGALGAQQVWILPLFGDRKAFPLIADAAGDQSAGRVSPNGKWIVYWSTGSGRNTIYITSFPQGVGKWQVSAVGTAPPAIWGENGKEIYFYDLTGSVMVASVQESAGGITNDGGRPLFRFPVLNNRTSIAFDVDARTGQRFIGAVAPDTSLLPLNVITNWTEELKKK